MVINYKISFKKLYTYTHTNSSFEVVIKHNFINLAIQKHLI